MASRATEWVFTKPLDFRDSEARKVHQGSFRVLPSPYATPIALRTVDDRLRGVRTLEVKYLSEEAPSRGTFADEAEIEFGRRTLRPMVVTVSFREQDTPAKFTQKVESALDSFLKVYDNSHAANHPNSFAKARWKDTVGFIKTGIRKYQKELSDFSSPQ